MKTIAIIFPNKLINFSDTMPFLYPMIRDNTITILKCDERMTGNDPYKNLARDVALDIKRSSCNAWQIIFFIEMGNDNSLQACLYSQFENIKFNFMPELSGLKVREPDHLFVITLDSLERDPYLGAPMESYQKMLWEIDTLGYTKSSMNKTISVVKKKIKTLKEKLTDEEKLLDDKVTELTNAKKILVDKVTEYKNAKKDYSQKYNNYKLLKNKNDSQKLIEYAPLQNDTRDRYEELNTIKSELLELKNKYNELSNEIRELKKIDNELSNEIRKQNEKIDLITKSLEKANNEQVRVNQLKKTKLFKDDLNQEKKKNIIQYLFTQAEINKIASEWDQNKYDIQVGLRRVNTDAGISELEIDTDEGTSVKNLIEDCCCKVTEKFETIIDGKKNKFQEAQNKDDESMPFRSLDFDTIKKNFNDAIDRIQNNHIIQFTTDDPIRHLLYKHLKENFSVVSEKFESFTCIRFTMHHSIGDEKYRENMLQLTYLLIFLIDNGPIVYQNPKSLVPGYQLGVSNFLHAKNIRIDHEVLSRILSKYYHRLFSARQKLVLAMKSDIIGDVYFMENPCECPGSDELPYDRDRSKPKQTRLYLSNKIKYIENNLIKKTSALLDTCASEMNQWISFRKFNDKLKNKGLELNKTRNSCHKNLMKSSLINVEKKCAKEIEHLKNLSNRIEHLNKVRITGWPLFLCMCISFCIFILPLYVDKQLTDAAHPYWFTDPTLYLCAIFLCVLLIIKWSVFNKIRILKTEAFEKAETLEKDIQKTFRENVDYINKVCSFNATNVNIQHVKEAISSQNRMRQMMHFHEKQLNDHIAFTDFLLKDAHPSHQAGITNTNDNLDINFAASVQQNPLYYPSDIQQDHWTYQLRIGIARKREVSIKSRHVPALDGITITYDLLYLEQP